MIAFSRFDLQPLFKKAYGEGCSCHGELNLKFEYYVGHLNMIIQRQLGANFQVTAAAAFFTQLHTNDLYLSIACAFASDMAWERFSALYYAHMVKAARQVSTTRAAADELAESAAGHLFLPDASGRSRIASYNGMGPLSFWLAVVIKHLGIKERQRKCNNLERLEDAPNQARLTTTADMESALRANRYSPIISKVLANFGSSLSERERFVLRLRYGQQLSASQIARMLEVNRSSITRQLERTCEKLRKEVTSMLGRENGLNAAAIEECLQEMSENSEHFMAAVAKLY